LDAEVLSLLTQLKNIDREPAVNARLCVPAHFPMAARTRIQVSGKQATSPTESDGRAKRLPILLSQLVRPKVILVRQV
jgi:hypothetical protein